MSVVAVKKDISEKWVKAFEANKAHRIGASNPVVEQIQKKAIEQFAETGIPDKKIEDYKYANMRLHLNDEFELKGNAEFLKQSDVRGFYIEEYPTIVMVNGRFIKEISSLKKLPTEISIRNLFSVLKEKGSVNGVEFNSCFNGNLSPMALLNTALAFDGITITVPEGYECLDPIHILHISTGGDKVLFNPRNIIKVGEGASLTLLESYYSLNLDEKVFTNSVTEIAVGNNATLNNYIIQEEENNASQHNIHQVAVGEAAKFNSVVISLDGHMVRNDLNVAINGEKAEVHMHGLFTVKDGKLIDNHSLVEHNVPNCFSNELYKSIIEDGGTGVFNGKVYVKQDAQKTNAYQSNKNILLGDNATINTKPQLEIYADDVKCSHGTSTGKLDETALFYLQSRGLNETLARKVLLGAFAAQVSDTINDDPFRHYVEERIHSHIA